MRYWLLLVFFVSFFDQSSIAQDSTSAFPFILFQYNFSSANADMEDHFNTIHAVGGGLGYKTFSNWQFELKADYLFSQNIKSEGLLDNIINEAGDVTDSDGELVKVVYEMKGFTIFAQGGKILPLFQANANSGVFVSAGVGFLHHFIDYDYRDGRVFQLEEDMLKGYDRLTNGFAIRQFVGYQFYGKQNLLNFQLGIESTQGFTRNRREFNYVDRSFDKDLKTDILLGFRACWMIPFKKRRAEEFYYY
jgi:hypothetical protein